MYDHTKTFFTISRHHSIFTSYFTEVARLCSNKHTLHTANLIEDETPRWGQLLFNSFSAEVEKYTVEEIELKYKKQYFLIKESLFWSPKRNRFDMLLYYFFETAFLNGTKIDLLLNFSAMYAPFKEEAIEIFWFRLALSCRWNLSTNPLKLGW